MNYPSNHILDELRKQNILLEKVCYLLADLQQKSSLETEYLTVAEFSATIKKSEPTVRRWIKKGVLNRVVKINSSYLIEKKEVDLFILKTRLGGKLIGK